MSTTSPTKPSVLPQLDDRYADSGGVGIHYVAGGDGPLILFIHGFPDFWYSWRHQLGHFAGTHRVAAMDTRGYNLSDQPKGQEHYAMEMLIADAAAVIWNEGHTSAVIVGHDWGGATAWNFAARFPEMTDRLVIINAPHPAAMAQELARPGSSQPSSLAYADDFRKPGSDANFNAESLAVFMSRGDDEAHERYREAFQATSIDAAMNYYRANNGGGAAVVQAPVLQFHGLDDPALLTSAVTGTWEHMTSTWTFVTVPNAGHWPHHDHPDLVSTTIASWLDQQIRDLSSDSGPREAASSSGGFPGATCCAPTQTTA